MTYEEWLALEESERDRVHLESWNTYEREGYPIALHAASRLALQTKFTVLDVQIETYHCGEYLLGMTVPESEYPECPGMWDHRFEGFRVAWRPHIKPKLPPEAFQDLPIQDKD
jgi:hypothetical protein